MKNKIAGGFMVYEKQYDLIELKKRAGLTYRDFAAPLDRSPAGVAQKFTGFMAITLEERRIIERVCRDVIREKEEKDE